MFNNYKIIEKNGEKILILYIDYNYEFGINLKLKHRYNSMKKNIYDFAKKINFNGEKIALAFGGIILATVLLIENPKTKLNNLIFVDNSIIPFTMIVEKEKVEEKVEVKKEELVEEEVENKEKVEVVKIKEKKEERKQEEKNVSKIENKMETKVENKEENIGEVKEENIVDNSIKVTVYRSNGSVITLDLDEYLIGVVGAEMPASFSIEALKVQAVISRTYALRSLKINRKLTDTVSTQVYLSIDELKEKWGNSFNNYYEKIKKAVYDTKDEAIYYGGDYIDALFFATSNGMTEDSRLVWGNSIPYLKSVDSSWDKNTTPYLRTETKDLENVLKLLDVTSFDFEIVSRDDSGRVLEIRVGNKSYTGVEFRNLLGLRSADFDFIIDNDKIVFTTRGYGHGVGLSQYGSNEMAKNGYNYVEIIKYYYSGVEVK